MPEGRTWPTSITRSNSNSSGYPKGNISGTAAGQASPSFLTTLLQPPFVPGGRACRDQAHRHTKIRGQHKEEARGVRHRLEHGLGGQQLVRELHLPSFYDQTRHTLKVCVTRNEWQRVLERNGSNPYVVIRNGYALPPECHGNPGIILTCVLVTRQDLACSKQLQDILELPS
jgi:hypothetical protein